MWHEAEAGLTVAVWLGSGAKSRQGLLGAACYDVIHHFTSSLFTGGELAGEDQEGGSSERRSREGTVDCPE